MKDSKKRARRQMKAKLAALTPRERAHWSSRVHQHLWQCPVFHQATTILIYFSMGDELDLDPLIQQAQARGKRVAVPRMTWAARSMEAVLLQQPMLPPIPGPKGIREPAEGEILAPEELDLVVVPGLAFDREGGRLGRGAGFYDRYLSRTGRHTVRCAAAFSLQLMERVPSEEHDQVMDMIITEEETLHVERASPEP